MLLNEYIVKYLEHYGVPFLFGVHGANIEDIYDACLHHCKNTKAILAKHEFSAACMADGASRVTGDLAVTMSTSGAGAMNLIPGLAESYSSQNPVLALIGMPPTILIGRGAFQDTSGSRHTINGEKLFSEMASKYMKLITEVDGFQEHLYKAILGAMTPPRGTSILLIPKDLQTQELNENSGYHFVRPVIESSKHIINEAAIDLLVDEIERVKRPDKILIILGFEVVHAEAYEEIKMLEQLLNAYVAVTPRGIDAYDANEEHYVGITGMASHQSVMDVMKASELLLNIGCHYPLLSASGFEAEIPHHNSYSILTQQTHLKMQGKDNKHVEIIGDIKKTLGILIKKIKARPNIISIMTKNTTAKHSPDHMQASFFNKKENRDFNFKSIFDLVNDYIEDNTVIFADAGNTGAAAMHYLTKPANTKFEIALGMGGMGYTFGASVGAALSTGKKGYVFAGDGAFLMHGTEIHTAIEHDLPIIFFIFNNNSHGMCYTREKLFYDSKNSYNVFKPAFYGAGLDAMFPSLYAKDIDSIDLLRSSLEELRERKGPAFLSLQVDFNEIPPFNPFLKLVREKHEYNENH